VTAETIAFVFVELGVIPYLYAVTKSLEESRGAPYTVDDLTLALAALTLGTAFVLYGLLAALRRHARLTVAVAVTVVVIMSTVAGAIACDNPDGCAVGGHPWVGKYNVFAPIVTKGTGE
jgi:hypothetical protein